MDSQVVDGVTFTMDTAERYTFGQARVMLHRDLGRKWGAYALFRAGMDGSCTVGGTEVRKVGRYFTITDGGAASVQAPHSCALRAVSETA